MVNLTAQVIRLVKIALEASDVFATKAFDKKRKIAQVAYMLCYIILTRNSHMTITLFCSCLKINFSFINFQPDYYSLRY